MVRNVFYISAGKALRGRWWGRTPATAVSDSRCWTLSVDGQRSVAEDRPLGDLGADRGQRDALVPLDRAPAAAALQRRLELLLEVAVEEAVDDGVDAGGRHGGEVAEGENDVVAAGGDGLVVPVEHGVEDV